MGPTEDRRAPARPLQYMAPRRPLQAGVTPAPLTFRVVARTWYAPNSRACLVTVFAATVPTPAPQGTGLTPLPPCPGMPRPEAAALTKGARAPAFLSTLSRRHSGASRKLRISRPAPPPRPPGTGRRPCARLRGRCRQFLHPRVRGLLRALPGNRFAAASTTTMSAPSGPNTLGSAPRTPTGLGRQRLAHTGGQAGIFRNLRPVPNRRSI